ncbi:MAG: SpoIIE family protein phosphatase [Clostridia bacterium]|nr:SpoIIE family protein phosphatase [Clostridia bacterium]
MHSTCLLKGKALLCALLVIVLSFMITALAFGEKATVINSSGRLDISPAVDPSDPLKGYMSLLYNNQNGLPTSEANAIAQTGDGFLWIGSYSGLIRYDGNTFERLDYASGIANVVALYVDHQDRLWIGTNDSGIYVMERDVLKKWDKSDGMKNVNVRAIAEDEKGLIYIGTTAGVDVIDPEMNLTHLQDSRLSEVYIRDLRRGNDGLIYGLTQLGDLFTLRDGGVITFLGNEDCRIKGIIGILPDPRNPGNLYLGTDEAVVYYGSLERNFGSMGVIDIAPLTYVERFEYINGQLWICAGNGIGCLDDQGFRCVDNVPMNNSVGHVMTDYEGNLWFTSTRQGVMKIVPNYFSNIFEHWNLPETVVNSTCMLGDRLFIATDSGLIVLENHGLVKDIPLKSAKTASGTDLGFDDLLELLDGVRIRSIIRDSQDRLWFSAWRKLGLVCYDQGDVLVYTPEDGLFSDHIRVVCERRDGSLMVANTGGLNIIKDGRVIAAYGEYDSIVNTEILTIVQGFNNEMVLGSDGDGIYIIGEDETRHIGTEEGLASEVILRIKRDLTRNIFWIVTSNSLAYMTEDYQVTTLHNFPYSNNFDIFENSQDEAWVISSNGIYILPVDELLADGNMKPMYFNVSSGLPGLATANSYSELTAEGDLYISGNTGVAKVNIENRIDIQTDLKAAVPYIYIDGKRMYPDESGNYTIPPKTRRLTISAYVFNYSLSDPLVSYCLEGFDAEPVTVSRSELTPLEYMNLSGGTYRFVMQVLDFQGNAVKTVAFQIIKEKSFYEETWFYVLSGLIVLACLALGTRLYIRRKMAEMEKKHQEEKDKERFVTELKTAKQIQESMLPNVFPPFPDRDEFDIYASMDPAREVGGDFYDFFLIDNDHLCLVMADVSGKGIPAALFMMICKVILQSNAIPGRSAKDILSMANEAICANNEMEMFVTVWLGILEISTGRITCANAGHEYPAICRKGRTFELFRDRHGFVLGGMDGVRYKEYELQLEEGDKLFLYTDGVPEAMGESKTLFGTDRMLDALNTCPDGSPEQILLKVRAAVDSFVQGAEQFDDLTMLCLEYRRKAVSKESPLKMD